MSTVPKNNPLEAERTCCPGIAVDRERAGEPKYDGAAREKTRNQRVSIPGGTVEVGTQNEVIPNDGEGPIRQVKIQTFEIDTTCVTNARFKQFVDATGYQTDAERIGWSFVFHSNVPPETPPTKGIAQLPWWRRVFGANWLEINGPSSGADWHPDHPVVQVSWNDAKAFARWAGGELPTEAQWEHAARGGLIGKRYPWGDREPDDVDFQPCNIWQGSFPDDNQALDGFLATAPAQSFEPNGYGLYNMCGNTWEWTSETYKIRSLKKAATVRNKEMLGFKLSKGGSFLCHPSYCFRYRIAARSGSSADSSTPHQGFRLCY